MERAIKSSEQSRKGVSVLSTCEISHLIGDVRIALSGIGIENPLFHAIKLVEHDELEVAMHKNTVNMVEEFKGTFHNELFGTDFEALIADARYKYITKKISQEKNKNSGILFPKRRILYV